MPDANSDILSQFNSISNFILTNINLLNIKLLLREIIDINNRFLIPF